jgi:hypothetical protein
MEVIVEPLASLLCFEYIAGLHVFVVDGHQVFAMLQIFGSFISKVIQEYDCRAANH